MVALESNSVLDLFLTMVVHGRNYLSSLRKRLVLVCWLLPPLSRSRSRSRSFLRYSVSNYDRNICIYYISQQYRTLTATPQTNRRQ